MLAPATVVGVEGEEIAPGVTGACVIACGEVRHAHVLVERRPLARLAHAVGEAAIDWQTRGKRERERKRARERERLEKRIRSSKETMDIGMGMGARHATHAA